MSVPRPPVPANGLAARFFGHVPARGLVAGIGALDAARIDLWGEGGWSGGHLLALIERALAEARAARHQRESDHGGRQ